MMTTLTVKQSVDYTLTLVTDRTAMRTEDLSEAVDQAIQGGCSLIQLREKKLPTRQFCQLAFSVKSVCDHYAVPLIINDRLDIALAVSAAGVHLGQNDLPASAARKLLTHQQILGISVTTAAQAKQAELEGADYLGVGAMFATTSKPDAQLVSFTELKRIRASVRIPIVVIGGIDQRNAALFKPLGINGVAVISALLDQPSIKEAAVQLRAAYLQCGDNLDMDPF